MNTKHTSQCTMSFGRYTKTQGVCPRCDELKAGALPRAGWQKSYFAFKKRQEQMQTSALKGHNCDISGCGPVCTYGDW